MVLMNFKFAALACALVFAALLFSGCASNAGPASATPSATAAASIASTASAASVAASPIASLTSNGGNSLKAQKGDAVAVDYVGTFDDGKVFDTSLRDEAVKAGLQLRSSYSPLEFVVGAGQMIKGFDAAVVGMSEGDEKTVHLQPSEAYGEADPKAVVWIPKANVPNDTKIGSQLLSAQGYAGVVVNINATHVQVDFNNPMAGKALNFRIIVRKITRK